MKIKHVAGSLVALAILTSPFLASAQTSTTSANVQVQAMLTQIQTLQAQLQALKTAQAGVQVAGTNVASTLSLIRNLKQGMSGDDVAALQAILAADPSIYPQGTVSGFYGSLTAEAVKKFQKKHGFDSVGFVGPKTLKKLNEVIKELGLSREDNDHATSTEKRKDDDNEGRKLCAKVPPGHLIAPGWLKKNRGEKPVVPECQTLPPGILNHGEHGTSTATTTPPVVDTTSPVISLVGTTNLMGTTTNVVWTTNEVSNSKVWFGTTTPVTMASSTSVSNASLVTSHSLGLSGLATSTTYYFVVVSTDSSNNTATSSQASFVTTAGL